MPEYPERFTVGGLHNQIIGGDLVSGPTIAITHKIHKVTGTGAIVNITPPWPSFSGVILLIPDGASTFTSTGNIMLAGTNVVKTAMELIYHPGDAKWYPVG